MLTYILIIFIVVALFGLNSLFLVPRDINKFKQLIKNNKYNEAMNLYKLSLESRNDHPQIIYGLSKIYESKEEWHLAIYEYQRLLSKGKYPSETSEIDIRIARINANKAVKQFDEIADDCYEILKKNPNHFQANYEIAKRLHEFKNYRAAKPFFERIINSENLEVLKSLLDINLREKKYQEAVKILDKIKGLAGESVTTDVKFKEIIIHYFNKKFSTITSIVGGLDPELRIPPNILSIIGIAYTYLEDKEQAIRYFGKGLNQYIDDHSEYIEEGRYLYTNLLLENNQFSDAVSQHQLLMQMKPEVEDTDERAIVLNKLSQSPLTKKLLEIKSIDDLVKKVIQFKLPGFTYIENHILYDGRKENKNSWIIFNINSETEKVFYLFFSLNFTSYVEEEMNYVFKNIKEKINPNIVSLPFIFMSLSGLGIQAEKKIIESFEDSIFYSLEEFIELIENKKLPSFPD